MSVPENRREALLDHYRPLRSAIQLHLNAALKCVSPSAIKEAARRIGLLTDGTIIADHFSEMVLAYDLAVFGEKPGRSRAIDRYAKTAHFPDGSPEAVCLKALQRATFRVVRVKGRHDVLGLVLDDVARKEELWLIDEGFEATLKEGLLLALRTVPLGSFHATAGAVAPIDAGIFTDAISSLAARRGKIDASILDDPRMPESVYAAAIASGAMQSMDFSDE